MSRYHLLLSGIALALGLGANNASAQALANLLADRLSVTESGALLAEGNVEAFHGNVALTAQAIRYDPTTDQLSLIGPLLLRNADGSVIAAEAADLDANLRTGLLTSARVMLNQQLQLAASSVEQTEGYKDLRKVAATSCSICGTAAPLWQIRASRVIHDEKAQQIYFENAQFLIKKLPVFWLPTLRIPDPDLTRARGFLSPRVRSTSQLGLGVLLPYFIPLGASRDLTVTPYFSAEHNAFEARYRQAFETGTLELEGLFATDHRDTSQSRSYASAAGNFRLGPGQKLHFDLLAISDDAVLSDYGISTTDRIESKIELTHYRPQAMGWARVSAFDSLRDNDNNSNLPPFLADLHYEQDHGMPSIGGRVTTGLDLSSLWRTDSEAEKRVNSMQRLMAFADWKRQDQVDYGLLIQSQALVRALNYSISGNNEFSNEAQQLQSAGAVTLSWPLERSVSTRNELLTPIFSLGWANVSGDDVPNEDSLVAELDGSNLHALSRLPGVDTVEEGWRLSYGAQWSAQWQDGTALSLGFGQIHRAENLVDLPQSSGLQGQSSDIVLAAELDLPNGFGLDMRTLVDKDFSSLGKSEARFDWSNQTIGFNAAYIYLPKDEFEARTNSISQWQFDGHYRLNDTWSFNAETRYDFTESQPIKSGLGIQWRNECVEFSLKMARRHASNEVLEPSTDFDLSVNLAGFTAAGSAGRVNTQCRS